MDANQSARAQLQALIGDLLSRSRARAVLLHGRGRRLLASAGDLSGVDVDAPGERLDGNVYASNQPLPDDEARGTYHALPGVKFNLFLIARRVALCVLHDARTTEGLVRLRAKELRPALEEVLEAHTDEFVALTDDDLDDLFA